MSHLTNYSLNKRSENFEHCAESLDEVFGDECLSRDVLQHLTSPWCVMWSLAGDTGKLNLLGSKPYRCQAGWRCGGFFFGSVSAGV